MPALHLQANPKDYLARRERRRLFFWVMGFGLVVLVILRFAELRDFVRARSERAANRVDTRFYPAPAPEGERDAVTIRKPVEGGGVEADDDPVKQAGDGVLPGIKPALLEHVRDDTPWIRDQEIPAWFNLWHAVQSATSDQIAAARPKPVGYLELFQQPKAHRGELVNVRGNARRVEYLPAGPNDYGISGFYRIIVWPEGGPAEAIFVYALELPDGFPQGEETAADIETTGIFFKRMVYSTERKDELRRAPTIVAKTVEWNRPTEAQASRDAVTFRLIMGLTALGLVTFVAIMVWANRGSATGLTNRSLESPERLSRLSELENVDVRESLRKLAQGEER